MQRLTPYGVSNFATIIEDEMYFVDKTQYIEKLEQLRYPVFLRPRRFGKTLFTEILRWYYDIKRKDSFERLFGNLYIGKNPTKRHNSYFFLALNFSGMAGWVDGGKEAIKKEFDKRIVSNIYFFLDYYADLLQIEHDFITNFEAKYANSASSALSEAIDLVGAVSGKLMIVIDEYDSLTNALAIFYQHAPIENNEYLNILSKSGFFRNFFETIKMGTATSVERVYITGILPITIADMNSGYNIAQWITLDRNFTNMLGITEFELDVLLNEVYNDYEINVLSKEKAKLLLKQYYDGYKFSADSENVYNPMMTMYFLYYLKQNTLPDLMTDNNLRIDYNQIAYIFGNNTIDRNRIISGITETGTYEQQRSLNVSFDMNAYKEGRYIAEGLYFSGILTHTDTPFVYKIPNLVTHEFVLNYFNKINNYDFDNSLMTIVCSEYYKKSDVKYMIDKFFTNVIQNYPGDFFSNVNESFYHGLLFWILWNSFPKNMFEVLPEYQLTNGQCDIMFRSLDSAHVPYKTNDLFELKRVAKGATDSELSAKLDEAITQMKGYLTGAYSNWRGICVAFRGNKDYLIEVFNDI